MRSTAAREIGATYKGYRALCYVDMQQRVGACAVSYDDVGPLDALCRASRGRVQSDKRIRPGSPHSICCLLWPSPSAQGGHLCKIMESPRSNTMPAPGLHRCHLPSNAVVASKSRYDTASDNSFPMMLWRTTVSSKW